MKISELDSWAAANSEFLDEVWGCFASTGRWPNARILARELVTAGQRIDVIAIARRMPPALGHLEESSGVVRLTLRGLSYVEGAQRLLEDYVRLLQKAVGRYQQVGLDPVVGSAEFQGLFNLTAEDALRLEELANVEGWPLRRKGGSVGDQRFEIDEHIVLLVLDVSSVTDYLDAQAKAWWPEPEGPLVSADTSVQQPHNGVSRYLGAPFRYVGSDKNRIADRILVGVVVTVVGSAILTGIVFILGLGPGGDSTATHTTTQAVHSTTAATAVSTPRPGDGRDPKESGCSPPAEDVRGTTVKLAGHGLAFGTLVLRHSPRCDTAWGAVRGLGPEEKLRLVLLTNRPSNHATTSYARFGHFNVEGVYGNELFQTHGCVLAIAVIEHNGKKLARAQTPCR
jgi:hypothetical protein